MARNRTPRVPDEDCARLLETIAQPENQLVDVRDELLDREMARVQSRRIGFAGPALVPMHDDELLRELRIHTDAC